MYIDSFSLYEYLIKLGITDEKRLIIDIISLRESYKNKEISEIKQVNGKDNPADIIIKRIPNTSLKSIINTNALKVYVKGFINRPIIAISI